ncbi:unnamed protein product, partial [Tetraodon nigroviridis]
QAEARLAAKRAARAEAREIRMRELERQQKELCEEGRTAGRRLAGRGLRAAITGRPGTPPIKKGSSIFQVQKKYYGLDTRLDERGDSKWGDIEQWMEDSERYSRSSRLQTVRTLPSPPCAALSPSCRMMMRGCRWGAEEASGSVLQPSMSGGGFRNLRLNTYMLHFSPVRCVHMLRAHCSLAQSDLEAVGAYSGGRNGYDDDYSVISSRSSRLSDESRVSRSSRLDLTIRPAAGGCHCAPLPASYASSDLYSLNGLSASRNTSSAFNGYQVEDRDYLEKGSRAASALTGGILPSLGGTSSRRGSGETSLTVDAETSLREIKEIHELKDQIQDVEIKYTQNLKEVKETLAEVEEKYRKAMVSNAQLDNEKNNLMYQVDTLKDSLMELEELLSESQRGYEEKVKELEREKHAHSVLQFQFTEIKETLKQSEELLNEIRQLNMKQEGFVREISDLQETLEWKDKKIGALERQKEYTDAIRVERDELREEVVKLKDTLKKHGIVVGPDLNANGDVGEAEVDGSDAVPSAASQAQPSPAEGNSMLGNPEETLEDELQPKQQRERFEGAKENHLGAEHAEIRLRKLVDEREKMIEQVRKLKAQLEQKAQRNGTENGSSPDGDVLENGSDPNIIELQRDSNRVISDLKFKLVKAEQEATALEQNVSRGATQPCPNTVTLSQRACFPCWFPGNQAGRSGDALQICCRECGEGGGRAEGRETKTAERVALGTGQSGRTGVKQQPPFKTAGEDEV